MNTPNETQKKLAVEIARIIWSGGVNWHGRAASLIKEHDAKLTGDLINHHYIRAIKHPAKLKKPKQAQAVKARRMWTCGENVTAPKSRAQYFSGLEQTSPAFVLPADSASVERMLEQGVNAIMEMYPSAEMDAAAVRMDVRAVLAAIGITSAKGGK